MFLGPRLELRLLRLDLLQIAASQDDAADFHLRILHDLGDDGRVLPDPELHFPVDDEPENVFIGEDAVGPSDRRLEQSVEPLPRDQKIVDRDGPNRAMRIQKFYRSVRCWRD